MEQNKETLQEFDFGDIMTDDIPSEQTGSLGQEEHRRKKKRRRVNVQLEKRRRRSRRWNIASGTISWILNLAVILLVWYFLTRYAALSFTVSNNYMSPAMTTGDKVLVIRFAYQWADPGRGDVIAFEHHGEGPYMARIIGLPGDEVSIDESGAISVNGQAFQTDYSEGTTTYIANQVIYPCQVPDDSYFVLCDNPSGTTDSRFVSIGTVSRNDILGKAFCIWWPKDSWGPVE